ncbi:MAG: hypothetical protein ABW000_09185 [Actinoplanes sp.]
MRALPLVITALSASILTGCAASPQNVAGEAGPAGAPSPTAGATAPISPAAPVSPSPVASTPAPSDTIHPVKSTPTPTRTRTPAGVIRKTDWANVTLANLGFMGLGDTTFRNGKASSGANNCTMLPGGARPAYAEYLTEEPANSPVSEDALILIECGSDGMDQALVPVQLGFDGKTREAIGFIRADQPTGPDNRMTFTSYAVEGRVIVTTVKKTDGSTETRRYRSGGGNTWERI